MKTTCRYLPRICTVLALLLIAMTSLTPLLAMPAMQQPAKPEETSADAPKALGAPAMLKVLITIARYDGAVKRQSTPYELAVTLNQPVVNLRMGTQVPIPKDGSYQFTSIGTNIDCEARRGPDEGRYALNLTIEDSTIQAAPPSPPAPFGPLAGVPTIQTFQIHNHLILKDGQSTEVSAADKVTGETVRVTVTLKVEN